MALRDAGIKRPCHRKTTKGKKIKDICRQNFVGHELQTIAAPTRFEQFFARKVPKEQSQLTSEMFEQIRQQ